MYANAPARPAAASPRLPVADRTRSVWRCRLAGTAGALALTAAALGAGALPAHDPSGLWLWHGPRVARLAIALAYGGLVLLVGAWWRLGTLLVSGARAPAVQVPVRELLVTLAWWATPLALAPPLYSSDVYSYLAQGAMALRGLNVYRHGPAALGGLVAHNVAHVWRWTPSPYGPVFMVTAKLVASGTGRHVVAGVFGMRAAALGGVGLIIWSVRRLATATGVGEPGALWLAVLNPLVLIHLVAGAHNDALMIGLMLAGFALARCGRPVLGTVCVTLATLVKWPAGVGLLFLPVLWRSMPGRTVRYVWAAAVAGATAVITTALAGTGYGWLRTQHAPIAIRTPMSVTTDLGRPVGLVLRGLGVGGVNSSIGVVQELGMAAALGMVAFCAWRTVRGAGALARPPEYALGVSLLAIVLLAPVVQPWYVLWGLIPMAATAWDRPVGDVLKVVSTGLPFLVLPSGNGLDSRIVQPALAAIALTAFAVRARCWARGHA